MLTALAACQKQEGPAEKAGKAIDKAVGQAGSALDSASIQAGKKIDEAGNSVRDALGSNKK